MRMPHTSHLHKRKFQKNYIRQNMKMNKRITIRDIGFIYLFSFFLLLMALLSLNLAKKNHTTFEWRKKNSAGSRFSAHSRINKWYREEEQ